MNFTGYHSNFKFSESFCSCERKKGINPGFMPHFPFFRFVKARKFSPDVLNEHHIENCWSYQIFFGVAYG